MRPALHLNCSRLSKEKLINQLLMHCASMSYTVLYDVEVGKIALCATKLFYFKHIITHKRFD